jgi:hypothetical protein
MVLTVLDISHKGRVKLLQGSVGEEQILSLEINFQRSSIEDAVKSFPMRRRRRRGRGRRRVRGERRGRVVTHFLTR